MAEDFSQYQKDVCEVTKPEPIKKICPTCIPDPNYMEPDWRSMVAQPYLNEKTCEYMVCVTINKYGDPFIAGQPYAFPDETTGERRTQKRKLLRSYVESGVRLMLEEFGKLIADQIICAYHHGPALDFLPAEIITQYEDFDDVYVALASDPAGSRANACRDIDLPLAPALQPEDPVDFVRTIAQTGVRFPEIKNPFALEIYAYPKEWTVVEGEGGLLKVLVAIPAYILDRVPDNPTRDEIEKEAVRTENEVILTVEKLWAQIQSLKAAFWVYSQYQSAFSQIQGGYLYTPKGENKIGYYASHYSERVKTFYNTLKKVSKSNGWNIRSNIKSIALNNARLVKITFDKSDKEKPYKVTKIEAKKHGCEYEEWTKDLNKLYLTDSKAKIMNEPDPFDQTVWNYIAKINEIDVALKARQSYPWMDFLVKFTYPLLSVDYGRFSDKALEETGLSCVANNAKKFGVELRDYMLNQSLSISDFISYEFNKKSCTEFGDLANEHEVVVVENERTKRKESIKQAKQEGKEVYQQKWQKDMDKLVAEREALIEVNRGLQYELDHLDFSVKFVGPTEMHGWITTISKNKERIKEIEDEIKKLNRSKRRKERQAGRQSGRHMRKITKNPDPYYKLGYEAALQEFAAQDTLLASVVDKASYLSSGKLDFKSMEALDLTDIMNRMTVCNLQSLTIQSVRCLFNGVTAEDAFTKIVKSSLEAMDLDVFGLFIQNLPAESQRKLREAFEKEFKDLPLPWEQGYDPGAISNTNSYIKYLTKLPPPPPPVPSETTDEKEHEALHEDYTGPLVEEVIEQPPAPPPIVRPTPEEIKTADTTWVDYVKKKGSTTKSLWYSFMSEVMKILPEDQKSYSVEYLQISLNYSAFVDWYNTVNDLNKEKTGKKYLGSSETQQLLRDEIESIKLTAARVAEEKLQAESKAQLEAAAEQMAADAEERRKTYQEEADQMMADTQALIDARLQQEEEEGIELSPGAQAVYDWGRKQRAKAANSYVGRSAAATTQSLGEQWANLTDAQRYEITKSEQANETARGKQGTYGTALGNIQKLIVQAYIEYMIDLLEIDELMQLLDRFPGSEILYRFVDDFTCAFQGMFKPPVESFLSTLSLDVCGDLGIGIGFPKKTADIAGFFDSSFLMVLQKQFVGKIEGVLTEVIKRIILKVLQGLDSALCKSLNAAAIVAGDALTGKTSGLDDAFAEAFCPDADKEELNKTKNNLFKASGLAGSGVSDKSFDGLYKTLNATTSKNEILGLLTTPPSDMDKNLLDKIAQLTNALHPEFSSVFGTPNQIGQVFGNAANYIPPELRKFLQDQINADADGPIYDSICLTKPQLDKWNADRRKGWENKGFSPEDAAKLVDDVNKQLGKDIEDLSDILQKGTDGLLGDALNSLLDPSRDPGCVNDKTALLFEDESLAAEKNSIIKSLFENIERTYMHEIINGRHAILNNILRDKNNFRLKKHERRADRPFMFPNYTNSEADWDFREEHSNILISGRMKSVPFLNPDPKPIGNYPTTVGSIMRDQLLGSAPAYSTQGDPQITLDFIDSEEETAYEFQLSYTLNRVNNPSKNITVTEVFHNRLKKKEAEALGIDYSLFSMKGVPPVESLNLNIESSFPTPSYVNFNYDPYKSTHSYQSLVFTALLENKIGSSINTNGESNTTFDAINAKVLNFANQAILSTPDGGIPTGFNFGYEGGAPLTFEDLWYVNPDASPSDKKTWVYTHLPSEAVLGKSATENPRVHFLDPTLHGGSYLFPKIYVEPASYNGWLGMVKTFIPEIELCEKTDNGFLNITQVAKRVKEVENNLPFDERLSLAPDCRIEVPYDKHFSSATHGIMEGLVLTTLKVYGSEFIIRTLPVFSGVEFSERNIDSTFLNMLVDQLQKGLTSQTTRWNMVQGYTYYLLFLEQVVQVVQRQIIDGLMEETPAIKEAKALINITQQEYNPVKIDLTNLENFDWSTVVDTFRGASIIAFGEHWKTDFDNILTDQLLETLAILAVGGPAAAGIAISNNLLFLVTRLSFLTPFKVRTARKINSIHQSRAAAEVYLKALMAKELNELMKKINLNMRPRPHVQDIKKYLLSRNGILLGSSLRAGEMVIEQPTVEGATGFDYGDIFNVVRDVNTENPLGEFELVVGGGNLSLPQGYADMKDYLLDGAPITRPRELPVFLISKLKNMITLFQNGFFYMEKYVRVIEKDGTEQVYNIKEFQERIASDPDLDPNEYISNYFGNAFVTADSLGGSIGVKFGVRLVYCPPPSYEYEIPSSRQQERTFKFPTPDVAIKFNENFYTLIDGLPDIIQDKLQNILDQMKISEPSLGRAIPVAVFEQDVGDKLISDINLVDKNMGEDLKCYVDKLVETEDYKVLFELCYPVQTYVSLFGVYSYYGFLESIGKSEEGTEEKDEDAAKLREKWKKKIFIRTKRKLRVLFNSTYRTDDDVKEEREPRSKKEKSEFMKNLLPKTFLNLDSSVQWWQSIRFVDVKPFDPDGNECLNAFQKMFR